LWAIRALASAIAEDPSLRESLPLSLVPECFFDGETLFYPRTQRRTVHGPTLVILRAVTAEPGISYARLREACASCDDRFDEVLEALITKKIVTRELAIPAAVTRPETWLHARLVELGAPANDWLSRLDALIATRDEYQAGDLATKVRAAATISERLASFGVDLSRGAAAPCTSAGIRSTKIVVATCSSSSRTLSARRWKSTSRR
jgi:hypothetical protein